MGFHFFKKGIIDFNMFTLHSCSCQINNKSSGEMRTKKPKKQRVMQNRTRSTGCFVYFFRSEVHGEKAVIFHSFLEKIFSSMETKKFTDF